MRKLLAVLLLLATAGAQAKPKVRAITAFVRLDRSHYEHQVAEALVVLREAKMQFQAAGYEVETIRITTQPLAQLVAGVNEDEDLRFLKALDDLSVKEDFLPNIGPAMLKDSDNPRTAHLLARALATLPNIEG